MTKRGVGLVLFFFLGDLFWKGNMNMFGGKCEDFFPQNACYLDSSELFCLPLFTSCYFKHIPESRVFLEFFFWLGEKGPKNRSPYVSLITKTGGLSSFEVPKSNGRDPFFFWFGGEYDLGSQGVFEPCFECLILTWFFDIDSLKSQMNTLEWLSRNWLTFSVGLDDFMVDLYLASVQFAKVWPISLICDARRRLFEIGMLCFINPPLATPENSRSFPGQIPDLEPTEPSVSKKPFFFHLPL